MYPDIITKEDVISKQECQNLSNHFLEKLKTHKPLRGTRGTGNNRLKFLTIDYSKRRTEHFIIVEEFQKRIASAFGIEQYEEIAGWISIMDGPVDLPLHVDPITKDYIRLITLLQKPEVGGEIIVSKKEHSEKTIIPLNVGGCYLLPSAKYFHGITPIEINKKSRIAMGFDYKLILSKSTSSSKII